MGNEASCCARSEEQGEIYTNREKKQEEATASKAVGNVSNRLTQGNNEDSTDPSKLLIETIEHHLSKVAQKEIKTTIIPMSDFDDILDKNSQVKEVFKKFDPQLNSLAYEGQEMVTQLEPLEIREVDQNEKEYYSGNWNVRGEACGFGTFISKEGSVYKGLFNNGQFDGKGLLVSDKGDYYFGDWKNGECEGEGEINCNQKYSYKGNFKSNVKNGKGIERYADGSVYEGQFENNEKHGLGKLTFKDGSSYEGKFIHSNIDGEGVYKWRDQREYEGEFKSGMMNGQGKHKWADGSVYTGTYVNNKKFGQGIYTWYQGLELGGNWMNNEPHGACTYLKEKTEYVVNFRFGKIISANNKYGVILNLNALDKDYKPKEENSLVLSQIHKLTRIDALCNKETIANMHDYVCQICQDLLDEPYKCKKCNKNYCLQCIYSKQTQSFGMCLSQCNNAFELNSDLMDEMDSLKLVCKCGETIRYGDRKSHNHNQQ